MKKLCKKMISAAVALSMAAVMGLSAMAVTAGYSDYGKSDVKDVVAGQKVELVAQGQGADGSTMATGVKVEIPAGVLPAGVTKVSMEVTGVENAKVQKALENAANMGYSDVKVLDISLKDQNGDSISGLNGHVTVTVPASGKQNAVLYFADNNSVTDMKASLSGGYLTFKTNHFSYYAAAFQSEAASGTPQTGDSSTTLVVIAVMSVAAVAVLAASIKAKKANVR